MAPKGKLLIIGGAEDRTDEGNKDKSEHRFSVLKSLLPDKHPDWRIEVVTSASRQPEEMKKMYTATFNEIGFSNFGFINIENKTQARDKAMLKRIREARAVFYTGGDQLRLTTLLAGTEFSSIVKEKYQEEDFMVAGTSAGAMAMSALMICGGGVTEALLGSDIQTASGFGLLQDCVIDTHFIARGRFSRLAHAIILNPGNLGIGLGEDTALWIQDNKATCVGTGMVVLIDGSNIVRTNISEAEAGEPVYVENLKVHLLVQHCKFDLATHKMEVPELEKI